MGHGHHHHDHNRSASNIKNAIWLNTGFALLELAGGLYTNSVAILSDALHDIGDSLSLGLSYFFEKKSVQGRDKDFSYGYKRFSLLGAFVSSMILVLGSVFIISEAIERLANPEETNAPGMLLLSFIGIAVNTIAMLRLKRGNSLSEKVVSLHFLEDVLGWAAIMIGSLVMMVADVPILDPVLSLLIAGYILFNIYKNLRLAFKIVLQGTPENVDLSEINRRIQSIPGVISTHDMHTWTMDGRFNVMTLHVVLNKKISIEEIQTVKDEIRHCVEHLNIQHLTIETELEDQSCNLTKC